MTTNLTGEVTAWRRDPKPDTGWHVVDVVDTDGERHTVTGCWLPRPGAHVELSGQWVASERFGPQFHVRSVVSAQPALTAQGVTRWLVEHVDGIGPVRAAAMLERMHGNAQALWDALTTNLPIAGVPEGLRAAAAEALRLERATGQHHATLYGWGLTPKQIARVAAHWPLGEAVCMLHANPYLLAEHIDGFGFTRADGIARAIGIRHDEPARLHAAILHYLEAAAGEGHVFGDLHVMQAIARETRTAFTLLLAEVRALRDAKRVVIEGGARVYLPELFAAEVNVAADLRVRYAGYAVNEAHAKGHAVDVDIVDATEPSDDPWQALAVKLACDLTKPIAFVTGGPGTGKTTILQRALAQLLALGVRVYLAAPTGKAARRMTEATGRAAQTLHALLGYRSTRATECDACRASDAAFDYGRIDTTTQPTVIIVDEASMVDLRLWAALIEAAPRVCLRFVGDAQQLPPVGAGQPFRDALDEAPADAVVRLRTVYRAKGEWSKLAAPMVLAGQTPPLERAPGFRFIEVPNAVDIPHTVLHALQGFHNDLHFVAAQAHALGHFPVLVPQRTGSAGCNRINTIVHDAYLPRGDGEPALELPDGTELRVGSWVMVTKNDQRKAVCNGDTAIVVDIAADAVIIHPDYQPDGAVGQARYSPTEAREQLRLAYATTVHKAQGSEYPWCMVVCHSAHKRMLTRRLLYTAITRAREGVVLVGDRSGVQWAVDNAREVTRCSWLKERLKHGG